MTLETALILFVLAAAGLWLTFKYMRNKPKLRIICLVLLSLITLALLGYIVLCFIFIDAIMEQPPSP